ncbi:hypothetical protein SAMN05518848_12023 [Paenibacillus sp. PDC88]|nr:hypothetical protein SAMN05518848_12023 [Paenibacillus sp. PDC88]
MANNSAWWIGSFVDQKSVSKARVRGTSKLSWSQ